MHPRIRPTLLLLALAACEHSSPITTSNFAEFGDGSFRGLGADAVWTADGNGLLFSSTCLTNQTIKGPVFAAALSVIPAVGGSISWQRCEHAHADLVPADSQGTFWAAALGPDGRLLYLESVTRLQGTPNQNRSLPLSFPIFTDAALWLTDSAFPIGRRRKLLSLYRVDTSSVKTVPDDQVDWLLNIIWTGQNSFVALGANLLARLGVYQPTPLRVVRGTIDTAGASLVAIAGTDRARAYSLAEGNATIIFNRDSGAIERVPIGGGAAVVVAALPSLSGRTLMDISCKAELCLVLSQEFDTSNRTQSTFWNLSLTTRELTLIETSTRAYSTARISPGSNTVLASGSLLGLVH